MPEAIVMYMSIATLYVYVCVWVWHLKIPGSGMYKEVCVRMESVRVWWEEETGRSLASARARANQDSRFIIYNTQERAKENFISSFPLYQTLVAFLPLCNIPFRVPSLPVSFSFVPESLSRSLAHTRGHFIGHRLCRADVKVYYIY